MARPAHIKLSASALRHNLQRIKQMAPKSALVAMIKADAYGHGIQWTAKTVAVHVDCFGVCSLEEAVLIQEVLPQQACLLIEGVFSGEELLEANQRGCAIVIHHQEQLDLLNVASLAKPQQVWLKINTGMNRLGFAPAQWQAAYATLLANPNVVHPITVMTHFACADDINAPFTQQQIDSFTQLTQGLPLRRSLANSAGIIAWEQSHADVIRPGIMLYGVSPFAGAAGVDHHLQPVMSVHSQLIAIHQCNAGDRIGYGGVYTCPEAMRVGVVAIGYGDGYPRHAPNGTPVLVNQQPVPLVGRVSMDMLSVDLRTQPQAKVGDPVLLWGDKLPVETIAERCGTIGYELLCKVTQRLARIE